MKFNVLSGRRRHILAVTLVVVACAATSSVALSAGQRSSAGTIKIGFLNALSGPYAVAGAPELAAVKLGIADVNNRGGVCGSKLELGSAVDDQGQANLSIAGLRKLVQQDGLKLIIGPGITPPMRADAPLAEQMKVFLIGETAQRDPWQGRKYVYSSVSPQDVYAPLMVDYLAKKLGPGKHKVAILYANVPYAVFGYDLLKGILAKRGWTTVIAENWDVSKFDFTAQAQKVAGSGAEGILFWGAATPADAQILKQVRAAGFDGPGAGDAAYTLPFIPSTAGNDAAGTIVFPSQLNTVTPDAATKKFLAANLKATKQPGTFLSGQAYDIPHLIAAAIKRAGCKSDPDSVVKGMTGLSYKGVNGLYRYTAKYKGGPGVKSFRAMTWKNGKAVFAG